MSDHAFRKKFDIPGLEFNFPEDNFFEFKTSDNLRLKTYRYPAKSPRCLMLNFHGLHSYSNNHAILGKYLSEVGCEFISIDQRGHGRSEGPEALLPSLHQLLDDCSRFIEEVSMIYPRLPVYLTGGSMGGALCFALAMKKPELVKGVVTFNPAIGGNVKCESALGGLLQCFAKCCPGFKMFKGNPKTWCESDEIIRYLEENPLNYSGKIRLGTVNTINQLMRLVRRSPNMVRCKVLIIVGLKDKVVNPYTSEEFYVKMNTEFKDFWIYDDIDHAMVFHPRIYQICERVSNWMVQSLKC
jgi:alpha-beta hydrolase superfamily lysophospholipase